MFKENTLVFFCLYFCHLVGVFGDTDTVKSVSVKEGDSVTLQINVTEIQTDDKIEWKFGTNRNLIAKINEKTIRIFDGPDGRFRDRLKLDNQTGSLNITNTKTTHSGLYEVEISNSSSVTKHRFSVTVNAATTSATNSGSPDFPIVLISAAAGFLLLLVAVRIFCICRKQRKKLINMSAKQEDDVVYASVVHRH